MTRPHLVKSFATALLCLAVGAALAPAQLATGDMVVLPNGGSGVIVRDPNGVETIWPTAPWVPGPGGGATSLVWNPAFPQSVFVGGSTFLGRLDFGPGGATSWWPMSWNRGTVLDLDVFPDGRIAYTTVTEVGTVDPWTEQATTWYAQPLATRIAVDALGRFLYLNERTGITRSPAAGQPRTALANLNLMRPLVQALEVDQRTAELYFMSVPAQRIASWRLSGTTILASRPPLNLVDGEMIQDPTTRALWFIQVGQGGNLLRLDRGAGTLVPGTTITLPPSGPGSQIVGLDFVGDTGGPYQTNSPAARLLIDGASGTATRPLVRTIAQGSRVGVLLDSVVRGTQWDFIFSHAPLVSRGAGAVELPSGAVMNIDMSNPRFEFLHGGFNSPYFAPLLWIGTAPFADTVSGQLAIVDPAAPDGFSLSAPATLEIR